MTPGRGALAKPALSGEARATGAVRTSGQVGPKSRSAVGDGDAEVPGLGRLPNKPFFGFWPQGKI